MGDHHQHLERLFRAGRQNYGRYGGGGGGGGDAASMNIREEMLMIQQEAQEVRGAVLLLEQEKLGNSRMKSKVKSLQETVSKLIANSGEKQDESEIGAPEAEKDYDELGRDFFLIGGIHDPLSLRYEIIIHDKKGVEHKSAERFYWYKMAEAFNDSGVMQKVLTASQISDAEEAIKSLKNFDDTVWDKMKRKYWEEGQRMKFTQVRWIANLLVLTDSTYLAVASQDKFFGTGWRKNRMESNKTIFWDGRNEGGKVLMKLRSDLKRTHTWNGPQEQEEAQKKLIDLKRYIWRYLDPKRSMAPPSLGGRVLGGGHMRGNNPRRPPFAGYGGHRTHQ